MVSILAENIGAGMGTSFRGVGIVTADHKPARTVRVPTLAAPTTIPERIVCNFEMVRRFGATLRGNAVPAENH
jgi:nucleoid DNA-binding protein